MTVEDLATADETRQLQPAESQFAARKAAALAFRPRRAMPAIVVAAPLATATGLIAAYLISKYGQSVQRRSTSTTRMVTEETVYPPSSRRASAIRC